MEMIELQIHYNNIHNYISENYCYFNYDLKYYTEDFKETLAKAWTATKNFIVKIWNMIVNWFKGLFSPVVKNWAKLFNQAQSNWSKLKKKIEKEEFTDKDAFIKSIYHKDRDSYDLFNKVINTNIIGSRSIPSLSHNPGVILDEILTASINSEKVLETTKKFFSDYKIKSLKSFLFDDRYIKTIFGTYTLAERIDGILAKNTNYISFISDAMATIKYDTALENKIFSDKDKIKSFLKFLNDDVSDTIFKKMKELKKERSFEEMQEFQKKKHDEIFLTKALGSYSIAITYAASFFNYLYRFSRDLIFDLNKDTFKNDPIEIDFDEFKNDSNLFKIEPSKLGEKVTDKILTDDLSDEEKKVCKEYLSFIKEIAKIKFELMQYLKIFIQDFLDFFKFLKENA